MRTARKSFGRLLRDQCGPPREGKQPVSMASAAR